MSKNNPYEWILGESNAKRRSGQHFSCLFAQNIYYLQAHWTVDRQDLKVGMVQIGTAGYMNLKHANTHTHNKHFFSCYHIRDNQFDMEVIRGHQTHDIGIVPNRFLPGVFMAVTYDTYKNDSKL